MIDLEKTKFLVINGKNISVDEFPKNIRQEIDFFDHIKEDLKRVEKEMKILALAATAQSSKISQIIEQYSKSLEQNAEQR